MSEDLARGDSKQVKTSLSDLQNHKQLLIEKLAAIRAKSAGLQQSLDNQRLKQRQRKDKNQCLDQQLSALNAESHQLSRKKATLEVQVARSRRNVQRLRQQIVDKRHHQSIAIDHMNAEMDQMTRQFNHLVQINNLTDPNRHPSVSMNDYIHSIDERIDWNRRKRDKLVEEIESQPHVDYDYDYQDWPYEHRMESLKVFSDQNRVLTEKVTFLQNMK